MMRRVTAPRRACKGEVDGTSRVEGFHAGLCRGPQHARTVMCRRTPSCPVRSDAMV
jgi:hypothetical protein